mmetsp:Transcript_20752/g.18174  ORF Transcript_20752/g.18174 Transcript_20752/m.18174 type:complete len:93 (+) Transcript_20752:436-714(+)
MVATTVRLYTDAGMGDIVVLAAVMTFAITLGLTIYAINTKSDWTTLRGVLFIWLMSFIGMLFLSIFLPFEFVDVIACCLGVGVYGCYLIYDT